jgi:Recombination endonuclease VII
MPAKGQKRHIERGAQYANLTVVCEVAPTKGGNRRFLCKCICDMPTIVYMTNLWRGKTKSCGCLRDETLPQGRQTVIENRHKKAQVSEDGRLCLTCEVWKPWDCFKKRPRVALGYFSNCKECDRWRNIKLTYGITRDEWEDLLSAQGDVCAVCLDTIVGTPVVDHDHSHCGPKQACRECVRGILCRVCNGLLGHVEKYPHLSEIFDFYLKQRPFAQELLRAV